MIPAADVPVDLAPRVEGWILWLGLVFCLLGVVMVILIVRRRLLNPMPHTPSDTTDAWSEAGRRLPVPPPEEGPKGPDREDAP
jgi:hypothetical protein